MNWKEETEKHIYRVNWLVGVFSGMLMRKVQFHDASKLKEPEAELFKEYTDKLRGCTYGSPEYKEYLEGLKPALDHHYGVNSHHPEHFENGIDGMSLLDLIEMFCDWKAASERHDDGDILKSIEINKDRFNMSPQLVSIFKNTVKETEEIFK